MKRSNVRRLRACANCLVLGSASVAYGQTWVPARTTPSLSEVAAIDATGEDNWPYGAEDVAGDGLQSFKQQERSVDIRTTYAVATQTELWARAYVSDTAAPGGNVSLYVFIDADRNPDTGGSAVATEIDERFTEDPSQGGYEYVVGVGGNEALEGVWRWNDNQNVYDVVNNVDVVVESGVDFDPIWVLEEDHGYVQFRVALADVGLDAACNADLFVRSLSSVASIADGDLDVGARARCLTVDSNGTPPVVVPPDGCTADDQCPGNGLCIDSACVIPAACRVDGDCAADERCSDRGFCEVATSDTTCDADADCDDLVCDTAASLCVACGNDADCGSGRRCAASGRCVDGTVTGTGGNGSGGNGSTSGGASTDPNVIGPNEKVQGGAFTCAIGFDPSWNQAWAAFGLLAGAGVIRRRATRGKAAS